MVEQIATGAVVSHRDQARKSVRKNSHPRYHEPVVRLLRQAPRSLALAVLPSIRA